jgi:tetratricopeptide (TPR) repeat protein
MATFQPENPSSEHPKDPGSRRKRSLMAGQQSMATTVTAQRYLEEGKALYKAYVSTRRKRDLGQAVEAFQKALEYDTHNPSLYLYLARSMWEQGSISLELAKFYCQTAIQLDPKNWEAYFTLGSFLYQDGQTIDAVRTLKEATRRNFWQSARASTFLGQVLFQCANHAPNRTLSLVYRLQGMMEILSGILRLPLDIPTFSSLIRAALQDVGVMAILSTANILKWVGLKGASRRILRWGSHMAPQDPLFYQLLGDDALFDIREPHEALDYYQKSLARDPHNTTILNRISRVQNDLDDRQAAKEALEKVIESDAHSIEAHFNLSQIYIEEGAFMRALFHLKECETIAPRDPYIHSNMAYVMFKLDDVEGALQKYKHGLSCGDNTEWMSTVSQTIATIYHQVYHDQVQALDYYQKALEFYPNNLEVWAAIAQLQFEAGRLEDALRSYRRLIDFIPDSSECYCNIGYILWQLDQNDQAVDAYEIALRFDPGNVVARNNLGVIYLDDFQNAQAAFDLFEKALTDKPDYTMACFNKARALEMMGSTRDAAQAYTQAKTLNANHPELGDDEIERHLRRLFYS